MILKVIILEEILSETNTVTKKEVVDLANKLGSEPSIDTFLDYYYYGDDPYKKYNYSDYHKQALLSCIYKHNIGSGDLLILYDNTSMKYIGLNATMLRDIINIKTAEFTL